MKKFYSNHDFEVYEFEDSCATSVVKWMGASAWDLFLVSSRLKYPLSAEDFLDYAHKARGESHMFFAVFQNGEHVAHFEIKNMDARHKNGTPAHIVLSPSCRGKGLGAKLAKIINEVGFEKLKLERLSLSVHVVNFSATAAYVKAGYRFEGVIRDVVQLTEKRYSLYQMSLLRNEYFSKKL